MYLNYQHIPYDAAIVKEIKCVNLFRPKALKDE